MKKTPVMILLAYLAISFCGVTFAWMSYPKDMRSGSQFVFDFSRNDAEENGEEETYHQLKVEDRGVSFDSYVYDPDIGDYTMLSSIDDVLFIYHNIVPGDYAKVRLDFTNTGSTVNEVTLQMADITTDTPEILEYFYFGINGSEGYNEDYFYVSPIGTYVCLKDATERKGNYSLELVKNLNITPTKSGEVVSIYCYILFNKQAGNEFQDLNISLGSFRIVL